MAIRIFALAWGQREWAPVDGVVTESGTSTSYAGNRTRTRYHFAYEYNVDGGTYTSRRYSLWQIGAGQSQGVQNFSAGSRITVYVSPDHPENAVIVRTAPGFGVYLWAGLGLVVVLAATESFYGWRLFSYLDRRRDRILREWRDWGAQYADLPADPDDALVEQVFHELPPRLRKRVMNYDARGETNRLPARLHEWTGIDRRPGDALLRYAETSHQNPRSSLRFVDC